MIKVKCIVKTEEEKKRLELYFEAAIILVPLSCGIFDFDIEVEK